MNRYARIPRKRKTPRAVHSERTEHVTGHKRVRLYGKAREQRRAEIFARAGGRCEEIIEIRFTGVLGYPSSNFMRCPNRATEWSHIKHGPRKCDCLSPNCNIASCHECHVKRHAGGNGKPCPKKEIVHAKEGDSSCQLNATPG